MSMNICLLNLSSAYKPINVDPDLGALMDVIASPDMIPESDEPLVLYILGHAVPDGLIDRRGLPINDSDLIGLIQGKRQGRNTLIIWDVCFALSFLKATGVPEWPGNYVHIFSSQAYERAWNTGPNTTPARITLFSTALKESLAAYPSGPPSWDSLNAQLNESLKGIQTATIVTLLPSAFPLT